MPLPNIFTNKNRIISSMESEISILDSKLNDATVELEEKNCTINRQRGELNDANSTISKLQKRCNDLEAFINSHLPLLDTGSITDPLTFESMQKSWFNTLQTLPSDDEYYHLLRQSRACDARLTPLDLCAETGSGHFRGTDKDYFVTLKHCDCMDFQRHAWPCKHMYRLAHEFGVFMLDDVEYVPDAQKIMFRSDFEQIISTLSETSKDILKEFHYSSVIVESRSLLNPLLSAGLVQITSCKAYLLDYYKRDELLSLLPADANVKRNSKKSELVKIILSEYPEIIPDLEKLTLAVELSPYVRHLI